MRVRGLELAILLAGLAALAGCQLLPERTAAAIRYYDLGTPEPTEVSPCCEGRIALGTVHSAAMLSGQTMWYRSGDDSVQPRAFAVSRWSAPPGALLEQHVRVALGVAEPQRPDALPFRLTLKLEVMEHQFPSAQASAARMVVSATLTQASDRRILANTVFSLAREAPSADPLGGARAMAGLADELVERLQDWMCETIGDPVDEAPRGCP